MSKLVRYTDWQSWWDGLRTNMMKAGATSIATNLSVLASTNVVSSFQIPGLGGVGENWKTFLVGLCAQFVLHTVSAAAVYIQANQPQVITETIDTTHITKSPDGSVTAGSSSVTTTTPVAPAQPKP